MALTKSIKRNVKKEGVLINAHFFCKAVGLKKPVGLSNPVDFMESYVDEHKLDWVEIAKQVHVFREDYKKRRREIQQRKAEELKMEEERFFAEHNVAPTKERDCLRCDTRFVSKHGNRLCEKCQFTVNNYLGADGTC